MMEEINIININSANTVCQQIVQEKSHATRFAEELDKYRKLIQRKTDEHIRMQLIPTKCEYCDHIIRGGESGFCFFREGKWACMDCRATFYGRELREMKGDF